MRRIHLASHLSTDELEQRYRQARDATERGWWQMLWLIARGHTAKEVAASTGYSAYWVGQLVRRYNTDGPTGMVNRRHAAHGVPTLLSSAQLEELRQALAGPPPEGEQWTGRTVANWMAQRLGRRVPRQRGWAYLRRVGARLRAPRPRHVAANAAEQEAFKRGFAASAER